MSKPNSNLWVAVYDMHYPAIDWPTFNALMDFIKSNKKNIEGFIFGGDALDNAEISHHTKGKPLFRPTGSYLRNHANFAKLVLGPIEDELAKDTRRIWIDGNHEAWSHQLVETQPELEGLVENHKLLDLEGRGWEYFPCGTRMKLGKLNVIHGETLSGVGNQASAYHAKKAVDVYAGSVLYGHFHSHQTYTRILPHDQKQKWVGVCSPILGKTNPNYIRNRPSAWTNGFTIIEMQPDGNFNIYPIIVSGGKFSFGGVTYGGKP